MVSAAAPGERHRAFGIVPTSKTGYGYIAAVPSVPPRQQHRGGSSESPMRPPPRYLDSGEYLWNSSLLLFIVRAVSG